MFRHFILAVLMGSIASPLFGQNVDYFRTVPAGAFRVPTFWTPLNQVPPYILGPGGATDDAHFNLGHTFLTTYTIANVFGINDQLIVEDDSVRLQITDYETDSGEPSNGTGTDASIVVGHSAGDLGIAFFEGTAGSQLVSVQTVLGRVEGSTGFTIVAGSGLEWNNSSWVEVGRGGIGNLVILNGNVTAESAELGVDTSAIGMAKVDGPDAVWEINDDLVVGKRGSGVLSIENGGTVVSGNGDLGLWSSNPSTSGDGEVTVDGEGSLWDVSDTITVGDEGYALLTVQNGGRVKSQTIYVDKQTWISGGSGNLVVDGEDSSVRAYSLLQVGYGGDGAARFSDGARVSSSESIIGYWPGSMGDVTVESDARWINSSDQTIGREGTASLAVRSGGIVSCQGAFVGRFSGSDGNVTVRDVNSHWFIDDDLVIGGDLNPSVQAGGDATVLVRSGGNLCVRNDVLIVKDGVLNLQSGGTISADGMDSILGGSFNFVGGRLHVDTFQGSLLNDGGTLAPGNVPLSSSPIGGTTITGGYTQEEFFAKLEIQLAGPGAGTGFDTVSVTGDVFLDGSLNLILLDGFLPSANDTFEVMHVSQGNMFGYFNNVGDNVRLNTLDGNGSFLVRYGVTSPNPISIILSDFVPSFIIGESLLVTRGNHVSGSIAQLAESDNADVSIQRAAADLQSRTEFEVKSTSPIDSPTSFEFTLEGSVFARSNVVQTIEFYDYNADTWELVDTSNANRAPMPDSVVTAMPTGDLSRFVEAGTMCIEARVRYQSDNPRQSFASNSDQAGWTIGL